MPGRAALRFLLEVVFIVAVASVAAATSLSVVGIVLVMVAAWLVVAGVEWMTGRSGPESRPARLRLRPRRAEAPAPSEPQPEAGTAGEPHHVRVLGREQGTVFEQPAATPEPVPVPAPAAVQESGVPPEERVATAAQPPVRVSGPVEGVPGEPGGSSGGAGAEPEAAPVPEPAAEHGPEPEAAPIPEPVPTARVLEVVPEPAREPGRAPEPEPEPEPAPVAPAAAVRTLPLRGPRQWNLWDLERLAREHSGHDMFRDEERTYLLMYLREFATADGILPADFDGLVRDSFGDLVGAS